MSIFRGFFDMFGVYVDEIDTFVTHVEILEHFDICRGPATS